MIDIKGKIEYLLEKYPKIMNDSYSITVGRNEITILVDYDSSYVAKLSKIPYTNHKITDSGFSKFGFQAEEYGLIEIIFT